ncbi:MAG TPA: hypothetical protein VF616_21770 [Duganella sp.]|uniref:hypothetical protein n=1 Tax=Duganella sp. TaxID=1904440 RepID=UPI002ED20FB6
MADKPRVAALEAFDLGRRVEFHAHGALTWRFFIAAAPSRAATIDGGSDARGKVIPSLSC